jgi:hypothetical protein
MLRALSGAHEPRVSCTCAGYLIAIPYIEPESIRLLRLDRQMVVEKYLQRTTRTIVTIRTNCPILCSSCIA